MTHHRPATRRRLAFTLVELLVSMALILFMMYIISSAFQKGLESFRVMKAAGDMQEKLRGAATVLRRDLTQPHFAATGGTTWAGENLSDQRLDDPLWQPPLEGYFRIVHAPTRTLANLDGTDPDDPTARHFRVPASVADRGDILQFTVRQRGARRDQFTMVDLQDPGNDIQGFVTPSVPPQPWGRMHRFSFPKHMQRLDAAFPMPGGGVYDPATMPKPAPTQFATTWTDVTYFLRPNGDFAGPMPLFSLYRRQNLLAVDLFRQSQSGDERFNYVSGPSPRPLDLNNLANNSSIVTDNYKELSTWLCPLDGTTRVNDQRMVTAPCRRFGVNPSDPAGALLATIPTIREQLTSADSPQAATDLLLTNVLDFEVKALWDPTTAIAGPQPTDSETGLGSFNNPDFPFDRLPPVTTTNPTLAGQRVFDTWSRRVPPGGSATDPDDLGSGTPPAWNGGYAGGSFGPKSIPLKVRVRAVQIELRIWDQKSQQTRQITIIQDL